MFRCERCGSRYSAVRAASIENCPRCQIRDRISSPLTMTRLEPRETPAATRLGPEQPALELSDGPAPRPSE